jgi:hypothetical protein
MSTTNAASASSSSKANMGSSSGPFTASAAKLQASCSYASRPRGLCVREQMAANGCGAGLETCIGLPCVIADWCSACLGVLLVSATGHGEASQA